MLWSETHRDAMELALDVYGPSSMLADTGPESESWPATLRAERRDGYPVSQMMSAFFFSRSETIWGGTSEIQRNIVGERVLGLPREPDPWHDQPWRDPRQARGQHGGAVGGGSRPPGRR
jgi:alkylation response protein AidB-like acyl-CoA dehydrogenase